MEPTGSTTPVRRPVLRGADGSAAVRASRGRTGTVSHPGPGGAVGYECGMWIALVLVVAAWLVIAAGAALLLGRTVRVADSRRPRGRRARGGAAATLGRVVSLATGSIPTIRPRLVGAVTGAIPVIRRSAD